MALRLSRTEMATLVPEAEGWPGGVRGWITDMGNYATLIGYAELLWPDFTELDGCVFRGEVDATNHQAWMDRLDGDRAAVERVCNHVDLIYLLNDQSQATDAQLTYLGRLLQQMWRAKLAQDFPGRRFAVELHDDPTDPDDEPLVTFSQIRDA